ncbi:HAD hydrolase family protein [Methylobacterium organophilum]|uniref:Capsule biosynthesis phosphatase n=1 Tax=Methylobacterium organophilum TaxID=410 RepID=A0ABQ4TAG2_METOR|nr:HAD hydrolase family protein [Methylobacterium organophilum]GJE28578.1 hypothetical protein LKMONMHP_3450 [Methylobacterium organophilum]
MKTIVMDLDGTLTIDEPGAPYDQRKPRLDVVEKLREMKDLGFKIVISTARNMNTFQGNIGVINVKTLPVILGWLDKHAIPYDEVLVGKPWCGTEGFYVDDKAIRPEEFTSLDLAGIQALVGIKSQN